MQHLQAPGQHEVERINCFGYSQQQAQAHGRLPISKICQLFPQPSLFISYFSILLSKLPLTKQSSITSLQKMHLSTATYFSYSAQHLAPINALNRKSKKHKRLHIALTPVMLKQFNHTKEQSVSETSAGLQA